MIEDDFFATVKLKCGDEVFAKVSASDEGDRTLLLVSNPIVVEDTNLENLKLFIGESKYNELFGQNGDLMNYNSVNSTIMKNNEQKSINYLLDLIEMSNSGEINIIEIQVE